MTNETLKMLARKTLSDVDFYRLDTRFNLDRCPTCGGRERYVYEGVIYDCDCTMQKMLYKHYLAANIPDRYHDICVNEHFEGTNRAQALEITERYLSHFEDLSHFGLGLTLSGTYGTGKTFVICHILKELIKQGHNVYFTTFRDLINTWGASWQDDEAKRLLNDRLLTAEVLGIDELDSDARNAAGFLQSGLDNVIRHRTSFRLPTLITTNMLPQNFVKEYPKVASLLSEANDIIYLVGDDARSGFVGKTNRQLADRGERRPIC